MCIYCTQVEMRGAQGISDCFISVRGIYCMYVCSSMQSFYITVHAFLHLGDFSWYFQYAYFSFLFSHGDNVNVQSQS